MTWREAQIQLQIEAEERVGFVMREHTRLARSVEDAAWSKAADVASKVG